MPQTSNDVLIQERLAQLNMIVARRNEFLRELYRMMRTKRDINSPISDDEDEDSELEAFLQKFDLTKYPETASISHLKEEEFVLPFEPTSQSVQSPSPISNSTKSQPSGRTTRSRSRVAELVQSLPLFIDQPRTDISPETHSQSEDSQGFRSPIISAVSPKLQPLGSGSVDESDEDNDEIIGSSAFPKEGERLPLLTHATQKRSTSPMLDNAEKERDDQPSVDFDHASFKAAVSTDTSEDIVNTAPTVPSHHSPSPPADAILEDLSTVKSNNGSPEPPALINDNMIIDIPAVQPQEVPEIRALSNISVSPTGGNSVEAPKDISDVKVVDDTDDQILDVSMELDSDDMVADEIKPRASELTPSEDVPPPSPPKKYIPVHIPLPPSIQEKIIIRAPSQPLQETHYNLNFETEDEHPKHVLTVVEDNPHFNPKYPLPPLSILPSDFTRKAKPVRRKKDKDGKKELSKDDVIPMGLSRWAATIMANPVHQKVTRATKCLSTREWGVAMSELRLIRTVDRIDALKDGGRWSFRQPKKQRGIGGLAKTHWDYLMDEMKWMRIDFREERRWKLALAYNLSTAVLEWHFAKTPEERLRAGICVKWKPSQFIVDDSKASSDDAMQVDQIQDTQPNQDGQVDATNLQSTLLGVNYGSDDGDDDDQVKDQRSVIDALEPATLVEEALNDVDEVQPKNEVDDQSAINLLRQIPDHNDAMNTSSMGHKQEQIIDDFKGLKNTSSDPILGGSKSSSQSTNGDAEPLVASAKPTQSKLAPIRERIIYSTDDQLFVDITSISGQPSTIEDNNVESDSLMSDLSSLFPDLQSLGMLDVAPPSTDGKKKPEKKSDRDDPNKRIEDTTYTKLYPIGRFMYSKPTLIGPLQPAKRFRDGKWLPIDQVSIAPDLETTIKTTEENTSELFDGKPPSNFAALAAFKDRDGRKQKLAETLWSPTDDALIKSLVDKYSTNWPLIAECFNSSRLTTVIDRRTSADIYDRWKDKFGGADRKQLALEAAHASIDDTSISLSSTQMTTRGVKRLASSSVSGQTTQGPMTTESRKRRKHALLQESVKKAAKKRADNLQKMLANQRKAPNIHETHNQFNKLPNYSPQELSRMKADKDTQDHAQAHKRQDELRQSLLLREQAQRAGALPPQVQAMVQQQQQKQQQQQQQQQQQNQQQQPQHAQGQQQQSTQSMQTPSALPLQQTQTVTQPSQNPLAQLAQLQIQAQYAALQRANGNVPSAVLPNRSARLSAVPTARTVSQQQALLQQARAMQLPVQLQAGGQANLPQTLHSQAGVSGNPAVLPPGSNAFPNLTQEQLELFHAQILNAQQQQQHQAQQQAQQHHHQPQ